MYIHVALYVNRLSKVNDVLKKNAEHTYVTSSSPQAANYSFNIPNNSYEDFSYPIVLKDTNKLKTCLLLTGSRIYMSKL